MNNKKRDKANHEFAFYFPNLDQHLEKNNQITIDCDDLYHRFKHVVRMQQDDACILFDRTMRVQFFFSHFSGKNKVHGTWQNRQINESLQPQITFVLPMLKVEALVESVYALAEVGISTIQLVTTAKTQTAYSEKLFEKLQKVAIAAAEQSKMYAGTKIVPPVKLDAWLAQSAATIPNFCKFHFDVTGVPFAQWYKPCDPQQHYYLLVGPEGDLTDDEKSQVAAAGFQSCFLTATVLRSVRAISLVSGLFRL